MSSHHIVREDQEPALLILNVYAIPFEKIQELLEWMPTVIVLADQAEAVVAWGIKIDIVITPASDLEIWKIKLADQIPLKFITYNIQENPLLAAFHFLASSKVTAVNCLLSHKTELKTIESFLGLDIEVFVDQKLWRWIKSGHFEKWIPANTKLFLETAELQSDFIEFKSGVNLVSKDGIVSLNSTHPFWIGEEIS